MRPVDSQNGGIAVDAKDGDPLRSGNYLYWDAQLQQIVRADLGRFCPGVSYSRTTDGGYSGVFRQNDLGTCELCRRSRPISDRRAKIPEGDLDGFIDALDALHRKANEQNVVGDSAHFIREFRVPDPRKMQDAWRVSPGRPGHLLVLWGFNEASTVLPLTETSKAWSDADRRVNLRDALKSALSKRPEKPRSNGAAWLLLLLLIAAAAAWFLRGCDSPTVPGPPPEPPVPEPPSPPPLSQEALDRRLEEEAASRGSITISMGWNTTDDLDLHVVPPGGAESEIFYDRKAAGGGTLDVDANDHNDRLVEEPVENVFFPDPEPGRYRVFIVNFKDRTPEGGTEYLVRMTVGETNRCFTGSIDGEKARVEIDAFDYPPQENGMEAISNPERRSRREEEEN